MQSHLLTFVTAIIAGAVNAVAGGGTLLTFPVLVATGMDARLANATNTMALWPASLTAAWQFRHAWEGPKTKAWAFFAVSVVGGACGSLLLRLTPSRYFEVFVPWLILAAATLFAAQEPLMRRLGLAAAAPSSPGDGPSISFGAVLGMQLMIATYGGYFGAGMGILMLAALSMLRLGDIYHMNFMKNFAGVAINATAALLFGVWSMVAWPSAIVMAVGAVIGGYSGAGMAKKVGPRALRRTISFLGFALAGFYLLKQFVSR